MYDFVVQRGEPYIRVNLLALDRLVMTVLLTLFNTIVYYFCEFGRTIANYSKSLSY